MEVYRKGVLVSRYCGFVFLISHCSGPNFFSLQPVQHTGPGVDSTAALRTRNRQSAALFTFVVFHRFVQVVCCVLPNKDGHKHVNVGVADGAERALNGVYGKGGETEKRN